MLSSSSIDASVFSPLREKRLAPDHEHVRMIAEIAEALDEAIGDAYDAGLDVVVQVHLLPALGRHNPRPSIAIHLTRPS
jgi:hypothetical protein